MWQRTQPPEIVVEGNGSENPSPASQGASTVDTERMNEWLASVTSSINTHSITESTDVAGGDSGTTANTQSNDPFDFMALFGSDPVFNESWNHSAEVDFSTLLDGLEPEPIAGNIDWDSFLPLDPSLPFTPSVPNDVQMSAVTDHPDMQMFQDTPTVPSSGIIGSGFPKFSPTVPSSERVIPDRMQVDSSEEVSMDVDNTDNQSVGGQSLYTIPTSSGASIYHAETPLTPVVRLASPALTAPGMGTYPMYVARRPTKAQRKAITLEKAREHRERILNELKRVRVERWELLIEGGVLRSLDRTMSISSPPPPPP
ncbi:hypothetical protein M422DRAFT_27159 [Sphaerobolus stellatus SS14]|nr:hypothetical protein M422DRAFT_27159 [Sphaerobolus stellatus SS14]